MAGSQTATAPKDRNARYNAAAPLWRDKMRTLGYYDAYLGFLSNTPVAPPADVQLVDVGAGTAAFSEAWTALHGPPGELTLLEPSGAMLDIAEAALNARDVAPRRVQAQLGEAQIPTADIVLAAHVIEHCPDPLTALRQMRAMLRKGGRLYLVASKPHWCNVIIWLQWRHRTFGEAEMRSLLEEAGFEVEQVYGFPSGPPSRTSRGFIATRQD